MGVSDVECHMSLVHVAEGSFYSIAGTPRLPQWLRACSLSWLSRFELQFHCNTADVGHATSFL